MSTEPQENRITSEIDTLIRARYPIVYIITWEERRVEEAVRAIAGSRGKKVYTWTITNGMTMSAQMRDDATRDPQSALDFIADSRDQAVFILKDFHSFIENNNITRRLRDLTYSLKTSYKTIVILAPILKLPPELEKDISVVDYPLPGLEELDKLLEGITQSVRGSRNIKLDLDPDDREHVLKAAQGLTATEAENVFAKSLVEKRTFDVDVINSEKEQIIRKSGLLEFYRATEAFADVGGLESLKMWLRTRSPAFTEKARDFGLPAPKGVMILGVQGCGKSLSCKAIASLWKLPLLRLDVGKIFGGIVGSSEENIRRAISVAESVAPVVMWIDELEKGFAGVQSSAFSDAGTTSRVFGTFITWMQDKTAPVFVVATANDISHLPPELLRKGRFDELFFVDLPSHEERMIIFEIHLRKRNRDVSQFDIEKLASAAKGFSGAEIEQAVIEALYTAFDQNREVTTDDIVQSAHQSVPLSMTMKEKIDQLREWASQRCRMASTSVPERVEPMPIRKMEL